MTGRRPGKDATLKSVSSPFERSGLTTRYQIVRSLGRDSLPCAYLAHERTSNIFEAPLVIKVFPHREKLTAVKSRVKLIQRAASLQFARIVECGRMGDAGYVVREYVKGETLGAALSTAREKLRRLSPVAPAVLVREVLRALATLGAGALRLHKRPFAHMGISPHNLVLTPQGDVRVLDITCSSPFLGILQTQARGSLRYLSPEVIEGGPSTQQTDIYSLGVILWEMCTMHEGHDAFEQNPMRLTRSQPLRLPSVFNPRVAHEIDLFVERCLGLAAPFTDLADAADFLDGYLLNVAPTAAPRDIRHWIVNVS